MILCKEKTEIQEAFRVGHHMIPAWLWKDKEKTDMVIEGGSINGNFEIRVICKKFIANKGDWIVNDKGNLKKYTHKEFKNKFEIFRGEK